MNPYLLISLISYGATRLSNSLLAYIGFEKKNNFCQHLKMVKLKICHGKKACFVSSGDCFQTFQAVAVCCLPYLASFHIPGQKFSATCSQFNSKNGKTKAK